MIRVDVGRGGLVARVLTLADLAARLPIEWRDRFIAKVAPRGECWEWTAAKTAGYGCLRIDRVSQRSHRLSYIAVFGEHAPGLEIDHLCYNRACVRPSHLEAVPKRINILRGNSTAARHARKTHCLKGHPLTPDNLLSGPATRYRLCKTCNRERTTASIRAFTPEQRAARRITAARCAARRRAARQAA